MAKTDKGTENKKDVAEVKRFVQASAQEGQSCSSSGSLSFPLLVGQTRHG